MLKYLAFKICQSLVDILPENISKAIVKIFVDIKYLFSWRDKRVVKENLRQILPEDRDISKKAKEVFLNFGKYLYEFFKMEYFASREFIDNNVDMHNIDILDRVIEKGKGGILLTGHFGNWELGAAVVSLMGYSLSAVALPHNENSVNNIFNSKRNKLGITVISANMAIRKCLATLRKNQFVAIAGDRDFSSNGEILDFLGKKVMMPIGPALFSQKTGAAIIPSFFMRERNHKFSLSFCDPIFPDEVSDNLEGKDKMISIMKRYLAVVEDKIKQYPTQWLIFRKFWI